MKITAIFTTTSSNKGFMTLNSPNITEIKEREKGKGARAKQKKKQNKTKQKHKNKTKPKNIKQHLFLWI